MENKNGKHQFAIDEHIAYDAAEVCKFTSKIRRFLLTLRDRWIKLQLIQVNVSIVIILMSFKSEFISWRFLSFLLIGS